VGEQNFGGGKVAGGGESILFGETVLSTHKKRTLHGSRPRRVREKPT